jgi:hypothetical protein
MDTQQFLRYNPSYWACASLLLQGRNLERFGEEWRMLAKVKDEDTTPIVAHKQQVTVPRDHQLEICLPENFPSGPAEVIVLSSCKSPYEPERPWSPSKGPHPRLGKVIFHEDPTRPLDPEDWPEE